MRDEPLPFSIYILIALFAFGIFAVSLYLVTHHSMTCNVRVLEQTGECIQKQLSDEPTVLEARR